MFASGLSSAALPAQGPGGRWDLTATDGVTTWPMWLEFQPGPPPGGRLQGRFGHALPLLDVVVDSNRVSFPMPAERRGANPPQVSLRFNGDVVSGDIVTPAGGRIAVTGRRAPTLSRGRSMEWGQPVNLLANGLAAWRPRSTQSRNGWTVANGELANSPPSVDLISLDTFEDFRLHVEVNVPPGGNSGIYLRGRHEVQVQDDYGKPPHNRGMGGVYGQLSPMSLPARPAGEWQTFDITLVGRRVTVVLNGVTILEQAEIPGITGGALDSDEGAPGPIMLQGDHSGVRYRNIRVVPAR